VTRLNADGTKDTSFATDGVYRYDGGRADRARNVVIAPDDEILVIGNTEIAASNADALLIKLGKDVLVGLARGKQRQHVPLARAERIDPPFRLALLAFGFRLVREALERAPQRFDENPLFDSRMAVAGDSVGGNMTAALTILAKQRGDVRFVHQSLYYPVTDAAQDTGSYREFADGPYLTAKAMAWFWDAYLPEKDRRDEITASPLRATVEDLAGLPEAFVLVDENDVLRDEGEAYARKLTAAGVRTTSARYNGTLHDFMMLNPVRATAASTAAVEQAIHVLRKALGRY
jgi:hypothetical protein